MASFRLLLLFRGKQSTVSFNMSYKKSLMNFRYITNPIQQQLNTTVTIISKKHYVSPGKTGKDFFLWDGRWRNKVFRKIL
jgi:hypothetical protein